jgi:hypothetical protein
VLWEEINNGNSMAPLIMTKGAEKRKHIRIPPELEKRRHLRIPIENVTVEVYTPGGEVDHPEICSILNLSESGMLFEGQSYYEEGQLLRLTFMLPETMGIIRTLATAMHTYEERDRQYVGVHCDRLSVFDRACIRQFVQKQESKA